MLENERFRRNTKNNEAIYIDSTGMTIEEEANEVINIIEEKRR